MSEEIDTSTYAQRRKEERKEELRTFLRGSEYLRQLHEWFDKPLSADQLAVARFKAEIALKLLAKCLPDLKAVEHSGEVLVDHIARIPQTNENAEQWQQQHSPDAKPPQTLQ